jgi:hypothetical protein
MKKLALTVVFLFCLLGVSYAQVGPYAGCNCPQAQRQRVAMGSLPQAAGWGYRAWTSPQGKIVRNTTGVLWRNYQMQRQAQAEAQRRYERARAELAWKINNGYAKRAAAPGGTPTRSEWIYNGVNRGDKSDRLDRSGGNFDSRPERTARRELTGPSWDKSFLDPKPSGGQVRGFSKEKRETRDTFTTERRGRDN